jgi:RNA polymerase sigma-70 factor (ECF subfamily)
MLSRLNFLPYSSDQQIIESLSEGGHARRRAEEKLFQQYCYFVQEGMKKYSLQEEEAFDAYTDTILATIESITKGSFEKRSSIKTFIYRVFNNKCVDTIRKKTTNKSSVNRTVDLPDAMMQLSDTAKSIVQQLVDKFDLQDMRSRMAGIGETCKALLTMFAEGFSDKEIAAAMNYKTPEVVKTSRLRCMQKLRETYVVKEQ